VGGPTRHWREQQMRYQGAQPKRSPGPQDARDMVGRATVRLCEVGVEAVRTVARPPPEAYRPGSVGQENGKGTDQPREWRSSPDTAITPSPVEAMPAGRYLRCQTLVRRLLTPPFKENFEPKVIAPNASQLLMAQVLPFQFSGLLGQDFPLTGKSQVHRFDGFVAA
jgi:hypothetical protein